jgi:hypothetical protein
MELSEATALAGTFITRVIFKVHSLPLYETGRRAALWRDEHKSALPTGQALTEMREHLSRFSVRDETDRARGRSLHLTISAVAVDLESGRCPALRGNLCGIYEARPLTCRTVPLHYSRPLSALAGYLDAFVAKPGHGCKVDETAPAVLSDQTMLDEALKTSRAAAFDLQVADAAWKQGIVTAMADAETAAAAGLPTHEVVRRNSDRGVASAVSMLAAWRMARRLGVLSAHAFERVCDNQVRLITGALAGQWSQSISGDLHAMLLEYEIESRSEERHLLGRHRRHEHQRSSLAAPRSR